MSKKNWDSVEGVVDVGPIVIAHCDNPAKASMIEFLHKVLSGEIQAIMPITTFFGAYHVLTKYLRVPKQEVVLALQETLDVDSPAYYENISRSEAKNALIIASINNIQSWDGYIANIARLYNTRTIYSIDRHLKAKGFKVLSPISEAELNLYNEWVKETISNIQRNAT